MAGNSGRIDEIIDRSAAGKQVQDTITDLLDLESALEKNVKAAKALNDELSKAKNYAEFAKASVESTKATKVVLDNSEKIRLAEIRLQQQREKAFDDYDKKLARQEAASARVSANNAKRAAKEIADSQKKQAQLEKEILAAEKAARPYNALSKQLDEARAKAKDLYLQFGPNSQEFLRAQDGVNRLNRQINTIDNSLGQYQRNVGNYIRNVNVIGTTSENTFGRVGAALGKAFNAIRVAAYILPGLGIAGIFDIIITGITKVVKSLNLFDTVASQAVLAQKTLNDAFASADYTKAITDLNELRINLDLAYKGFIDKDRVIDEYNESIGRVAGRVDTLDEAEKGLVKNGPAFLRITLLKAAAQLALADAAKKTYEAQQIANKSTQDFGDLGQDIAAQNNKGNILSTLFPVLFADENEQIAEQDKIRAKRREKVVSDTTAQANKFLNIATKFQTDAAKIAQKNNFTDLLGGGSGPSQTATVKNDLANVKLELAKKRAQEIIDNDKLSYSKRLAAQMSFDSASKQIALNNYNLALTDKTLSKNQLEKLEIDYQSELYDIDSSTNKKRRDFASQLSKDLVGLYTARLERQKAAEEEIISDETKGYRDRLTALDTYEKLSIKLIKLSANEQVKDAGENTIKIKAIREKEAADIAQVMTDGNKKQKQIQQDINDAVIKLQQQRLAELKAGLAQEILSFQDAQNQKLLAIDKLRSNQASVLAKQYKDGKISALQYNQDLYKIDEGAALARADVQIGIAEAAVKAQAAAIALGFGNAKDLQKSTDDLARLQIQKSDLVTANELNNIRKVEEARKQLADKQQELALKTIDLLQTIVDNGYQSQIDALEEQSKQVDKNAEQEKKVVDNSLMSSKQKADANAVIDAKAQAQKEVIAEKERKIKQDQAKFDKAIAIAKIIESTAVAIVQALTIPIVGFALAATIGAIGAVELATVLATPLPKYATGTKDKPTDGFMMIGERGKELVINPDGSSYLSPDKATISYGKKGTVVVPHMQTMQILKPPGVASNDRTQIGWQEVVDAIKANKVKPDNRPVQATGWLSEMSKADKYKAYKKRMFE